MRDGVPSAAGVFRRHHEPVWRYLRRQAGSREEADDLAQETFLRVARSLDGYEDRGTERAWVFRIARNVLANHRRAAGRRPEHVASDEVAGPPGAAVVELRLGLDAALAALPEADREAFLLREVGGLGYDEIAAACDLTADAVRNRIHRARVALRRALAPGDSRGLRNEATS